MPFQDELRENEIRELFELERLPGAGRGDTDAIMRLDNDLIVEFELKSTSKESVTTVRDFGPEHITKWRTKHWLIGFYDANENLKYCLYGSPARMKQWIDEKKGYIQPDFHLALLVPELITHNIMHQIIGAKGIYTLEDAKSIHKKQYKIKEYRAKMDIPGGYSSDRMLQILKERCKYIIERGSTLNNPHIPASYFVGWEKITSNHGLELRRMVKKYFAESN